MIDTILQRLDEAPRPLGFYEFFAGACHRGATPVTPKNEALP